VATDWMMEQVVRKDLLGATTANEIFRDLDFADDTSLLAETLEVIILAPKVMQKEAVYLAYSAGA